MEPHTTMHKVVCPDCNAGKITAGCSTDHPLISVDCHRCKGTGHILLPTISLPFSPDDVRNKGAAPVIVDEEHETLIYWLLRAYYSGHREGWERGSSTDETMNEILDVLANRGFDPNIDQAAKDLIEKFDNQRMTPRTGMKETGDG